MKITTKTLTEGIVEVLALYPNGASADDILRGLAWEVHLRTLQRHLKDLSAKTVISRSGRARATLYHLADSTEAIVSEPEGWIVLSKHSERLRRMVTAPPQKRRPVGYRRDFLESYRPNVDSYLSVEEKKKLAAIGEGGGEQPAGTYARQILNRLLIDLSWNSSRLEGNTYSLLDTERLIWEGESDDTKSGKETQMILNHKEAIEFMVDTAADIGFDNYTIRNLHAMLANNLLSDPEGPGSLRKLPVGITGSVFTPLAIPQLISELFDLILAKASEIRDPFEQSFFVMVHLPYLEPFVDVNKRVSRLAANIPFIRSNFSPLSFTDVPEDLYTQAMLGVYELNDVSLLKDVFKWGYERSASRYMVVRQSLGEPDRFRLRYRNEIRETISVMIRNNLNTKIEAEHIRDAAAGLPAEDQAPFITTVETELRALHEGNFARYRVSLKEFLRWKESR